MAKKYTYKPMSRKTSLIVTGVSLILIILLTFFFVYVRPYRFTEPNFKELIEEEAQNLFDKDQELFEENANSIVLDRSVVQHQPLRDFDYDGGKYKLNLGLINNAFYYIAVFKQGDITGEYGMLTMRMTKHPEKLNTVFGKELFTNYRIESNANKIFAEALNERGAENVDPSFAVTTGADAISIVLIVGIFAVSIFIMIKQYKLRNDYFDAYEEAKDKQNNRS